MAILLILAIASAALILALTAYQALQNTRFASPAAAPTSETAMTSSAVQSIDFAAGRRAVRDRPLRSAAVQAVAEQLFVTENAVDSAATEVGRLFAAMLAARRSANISTTVGQPLLEDATAAQAAIVDALQRVSALHAAGLKLADSLGVPRMDFGEGPSKPAPDQA